MTATRDRLKAGLCVVIGCGNASAPGSPYCESECVDNDYTLTDEQQATALGHA